MTELSADLEKAQLSASDAINYYEGLKNPPHNYNFTYDMKYIVPLGSEVVAATQLQDAVYQMISSATVLINSDLENLDKASEGVDDINTERINFYRINSNIFRAFKEGSDESQLLFRDIALDILNDDMRIFIYVYTCRALVSLIALAIIINFITKIINSNKNVLVIFGLIKDWQVEAMIEDCQTFKTEFLQDLNLMENNDEIKNEESSEDESQEDSESDDGEIIIEEDLDDNYDNESNPEDLPDEDYDMMTIKNENVNPKMIRSSKKRKTLTGKKGTSEGTLTKDPEIEALKSHHKKRGNKNIMKKRIAARNSFDKRRGSSFNKLSNLQFQIQKHKEPDSEKNSTNSRYRRDNEILDTDLDLLEAKMDKFRSNNSVTQYMILLLVCPLWVSFWVTWGALILVKYK